MLDNQSASFLDDAKIMRRSSDWNSDEHQANRFAAALLMPRALIDSALEKTLWFPWDDKKSCLAKTFQVSEESMGYRLNSLGKISL